ncbi:MULTISPECIES: hypothetical protein [Sphingomonas]|uniref:hypothetical protein n=1 Tax=Sphingomonas TaxID=13687 RepID=UPI000DEF6817|nr:MULTISPECIES: hypothetical protein [Sphingomonas]
MSAPVKFLAVAVAGWVTFRAAASALAFPEVAAPPPPTPVAPAVQPATAAPAVAYAPLGPGQAGGSPGAAPYGYPYGYVPAGYPYPPPQPYPAAYGYAPPGYGAAPPVRQVSVPIYYPVPVQMASAAMPLPRQRPWANGASGSVDPEALADGEAPESRPMVDVMPGPGGGKGPGVVALDQPGPPRLDRLSLSTWSLVRQDRHGELINAPLSPALAPGGQLGGSQAGARLTYRFTPRLAANVRFSAPVPSPGSRQRGFSGETALGVSWQPLAALPVRLMAERRQRIGNPLYGGGRNAFALLAEGGAYDKPLPLGFSLDGYGQTGIVSARQRDWFVDGGATFTRALFGRYSAGVGLWGGAQKGLNRLDVGPRVSAQLTRNVRVNLDYRFRAVGNARPGSGFAVGLGSNF